MNNILEVRGLSVGIRDGKKTYGVVDSIDFEVRRGEILGIVGESGCGKTVTVLSILGLTGEGVNPTGGQVFFEGRDLLAMREEEKQKILGDEISIIYQEPMSSLNPLLKIGRQVGEPLRIHTKKTDEEIRAQVLRLLADVDLKNPEKVYDSYPHELSGGMRQRVMLAMAGISAPKILVCDEPTTALDVTTQAEVLELIRKWNRQFGTSVIFISHDLAVINKLCDRVIVMYAGKIAECGKTETIIGRPGHPYTQGLIASIPTMRQKGQPLSCIPGRVPSVTDRKDPCPFAPRCGICTEECRQQVPPHITMPEEGHEVYCHHALRGADPVPGGEQGA